MRLGRRLARRARDGDRVQAAAAQIRRDLAPRAPYFHDGQAATLMDVVDFYNNRFQIGLTSQEKTDLVNFLNSL